MKSAPPVNPRDTSTMQYQFADNNMRTDLVYYSFSIFAMMSAIIFLLDIYFLNFFYKINTLTLDTLKVKLININNLNTKLTILTILIYVICAFIFSFWIYRASNNAHALYPERQFKFTPGWCIGSYFIPIINVFWPYIAMEEIWIESKINNNKSYILLIWWISFLLRQVLVVNLNKLPVDTISNIQTYLIVSSASEICGVVSAITAIIIVTNINRSQTNTERSA